MGTYAKLTTFLLIILEAERGFSLVTLGAPRDYAGVDLAGPWGSGGDLECIFSSLKHM